MRSQELVARPPVEQRRETLRRSLRRRARGLLLEQELAQLREGRTSRRERAETVLLVGRQETVEDGEALAPDANSAGLAICRTCSRLERLSLDRAGGPRASRIPVQRPGCIDSAGPGA